MNVTLDPEHAAKLTRLAEHTHVQEGTLAFERAQRGLGDARAGRTIGLDEL